MPSGSEWQLGQSDVGSRAGSSINAQHGLSRKPLGLASLECSALLDGPLPPITPEQVLPPARHHNAPRALPKMSLHQIIRVLDGNIRKTALCMMVLNLQWPSICHGPLLSSHEAHHDAIIILVPRCCHGIAT